jgi:hypothetical protein
MRDGAEMKVWDESEEEGSGIGGVIEKSLGFGGGVESLRRKEDVVIENKF